MARPTANRWWTPNERQGMEKLTPQQIQRLQIQHCERRLKERFDLGPEHYHGILSRIANGQGKLVKESDKVQDTYIVKMNYLGNNIRAVVDSKHNHLLTVYPDFPPKKHLTPKKSSGKMVSQWPKKTRRRRDK